MFSLSWKYVNTLFSCHECKGELQLFSFFFTFSIALSFLWLLLFTFFSVRSFYIPSFFFHYFSFLLLPLFFPILHPILHLAQFQGTLHIATFEIVDRARWCNQWNTIVIVWTLVDLPPCIFRRRPKPFPFSCMVGNVTLLWVLGLFFKQRRFSLWRLL